VVKQLLWKKTLLRLTWFCGTDCVIAAAPQGQSALHLFGTDTMVKLVVLLVMLVT
jgi:hypothetical protein